MRILIGHVHSKRRYFAPRQFVAAMLSTALVWLGIPTVQADQSAATVRYVDNHGELFRLDFSDFANVHPENISSGPATWHVTLDHGVFPGGMSREEYFVFENSVETSPFIDLGVDPAESAQAVGTDISMVAWEQVVRLDVTSTSSHFVFRYATQVDYLEISYPKSFVLTGYGVDPSHVVTIDINGEVALVSQQLFNKLGSGDPGKIEPMLDMFPASVSAAAATLTDPSGLLNAVMGLESMTLATKGISADIVQSCWGVCMSCAGTLILFGASLAGIILACGSSLVSGGSTAVLCILAFVGATGAAAVSLGSCSDCASCGDDDDPICPCRGQLVCDCA